MPAGLNDDNPATGYQSGSQIGGIRIPNLISNRRAIGVLAAFDGVIDQQSMSSVSGNPRENAARHIGRAVSQRPVLGGLVVTCDSSIEKVLIELASSNLAAFAAELSSKRSSVTRGDYALAGVVAHVPGRERDIPIS